MKDISKVVIHQYPMGVNAMQTRIRLIETGDDTGEATLETYVSLPNPYLPLDQLVDGAELAQQVIQELLTANNLVLAGGVA